MNGRPLATKILSVGIQMDWQLGQCCLDGWNAGIAGSLQVRFELAHCLKGLALQSLGVAHKHTWPFRQLVTLCFVPAVTRVWNTWSSYERFKKVVTTVTTHDMDHMNDMDDILGNPKAFFAASGWCSAYMAPKHLAQIITVLLSQPDPFNSLTSRHVKRPSLDLLILHDAAENSAIAVAMLCFSQLQRSHLVALLVQSWGSKMPAGFWTNLFCPTENPIQTIAPCSNMPSMIREVAHQKLDLLAQHLQDLFELKTSTLQKTLPEACDNSHWPWQWWFREYSQANSICMVLQCTTHVQTGAKQLQNLSTTHDLDLL